MSKKRGSERSRDKPGFVQLLCGCQEQTLLSVTPKPMLSLSSIFPGCRKGQGGTGPGGGRCWTGSLFSPWLQGRLQRGPGTRASRTKTFCEVEVSGWPRLHMGLGSSIWHSRCGWIQADCWAQNPYRNGGLPAGSHLYGSHLTAIKAG